MTTPQPWSPPITSTAIRIKMESTRNLAGPRPGRSGSAAGSHRNHLASLVIAAGGAHPVRHVRGGALGARAQLGQPQHAVIRPAHALAAFGWFSLGNTHISIKVHSKFQFVQFGPSVRTRFGRSGTAALLGFARLRDWQTPAFRVTQRMLPTLQENIFPHQRST